MCLPGLSSNAGEPGSGGGGENPPSPCPRRAPQRPARGPGTRQLRAGQPAIIGGDFSGPPRRPGAFPGTDAGPGPGPCRSCRPGALRVPGGGRVPDYAIDDLLTTAGPASVAVYLLASRRDRPGLCPATSDGARAGCGLQPAAACRQRPRRRDPRPCALALAYSPVPRQQPEQAGRHRLRLPIVTLDLENVLPAYLPCLVLAGRLATYPRSRRRNHGPDLCELEYP